MRVLFPYLARWHSANWSRYHHLLGALAARGHEVVVLQAPPRPEARETNYLEIGGPAAPGIEVLDVPVPAALWRRRFPLDKLVKKGLVALATRRAVAAVARERQIDVLLLYNVPQVVLARATQATVVVDLADDLLAMLAHEAGPWVRPFALPAARLALRSLRAAADLVITPSSVLAEQLGAGVQIVPNGADLAATARADGNAVRARYPGPIVGFVGAFEYFVDFDLVLDTAARLPRCSFVLVGGGRDWVCVRAAAQRRGLANVYCPGPVDYATALEHMAAFDVALAPFVADAVGDAASPLKLFEYGALRRPVLCTPTTEIRRIAGAWAHFGATTADWAAGIEAILAAPAAAGERAEAGAAAIVARYRWDHIAAGLERLILDRWRGRVGGSETTSELGQMERATARAPGGAGRVGGEPPRDGTALHVERDLASGREAALPGTAGRRTGERAP
ncbi:MAG TPA: glycosyltransferase [Chloroflexota bacterium]